MKKHSICVLIVTYNRKELLLNVFNSLLKQTLLPKAIAILDNDSTDGTDSALIRNNIIKDNYQIDVLNKYTLDSLDVYYYKSSSNMGGSGGFAKLIELFSCSDFDYLWLMDDDVEAENNCLEKLVEGMSETTMACVPSRNDENWIDYAIVDYDLNNPFKYKLSQIKTKVKASDINDNYIYVVDFPFEGPLLKKDLIEKVGTPSSDYFITYDDTDYARRILDYSKIKYIPDAILHRKNVLSSKDKRVWSWKSYYGLRNQFYFDLKYGNRFVKLFRPTFSALIKIISCVLRFEFKYISIITKAYKDAKNGRMGKTIDPQI